MRSSGERTHVYLNIYIYIYIVTARPSSPQEGARSRSPQLLRGRREEPGNEATFNVIFLVNYVLHSCISILLNVYPLPFA